MALLTHCYAQGKSSCCPDESTGEPRLKISWRIEATHSPALPTVGFGAGCASQISLPNCPCGGTPRTLADWVVGSSGTSSFHHVCVCLGISNVAVTYLVNCQPFFPVLDDAPGPVLCLNGAPSGTLLSLHSVWKALADDFGPRAGGQGKPPAPPGAILSPV